MEARLGPRLQVMSVSGSIVTGSKSASRPTRGVGGRGLIIGEVNLRFLGVGEPGVGDRVSVCSLVLARAGRSLLGGLILGGLNAL